MHRTIGLVVLECFAMLSHSQGTLLPAAKLENLCFADGLKYPTIQDAITGCGANGTVVIPPNNTEKDSAGNPDGIGVFDFRDNQNPRGLTPVTAFGVKGDAAGATNGVSQSGSAIFTSSTATFSNRDVGKTIVITGAGPENASLTTSIAGVDSPTRVTLAKPAEFTARGLTYWYGTENTSALESAYQAEKPLFLPPGKYLMTGTIKGSTPLFLTGSGDQSILIDDTTVFELRGSKGNFLNNFRMQSATELTAIRPDSFPTPHTGTPVAVDRIGAGIGYQPELQDFDVWPKASKQQKEQNIGPTVIIVSSDQTHIYRITGDLVSLLLFDTQYSEVSMCDFRAGKNWVAGIALWHTPKNGLMNRHDAISYNRVRYASYNGIAWAASEKVSIRHNVSENNGESGLKNYGSQSDGTYDSYVEILDNQTRHNHYDGFDLSEDVPHTNSHRSSSVVSGNASSFNDRTGTYGDGLGWTITNNTFEGNGLSGISLDVSDSVISGNTLLNNNTLHEANSHQMLLSPGKPSQNNTIENNRIVGDRASGAAIKWSPQSTGNKVRKNTASGGAFFWFAVPPVESRENFDSRGRYTDR